MAGSALLLAACAAAAAPEYPELLALFDYDRARPPEVRVAASEARAEGQVEELNFPSPKGGRVTATLVRPSGSGPFPAILYQHGDSGDRTSFLPEALLAARLGAAALLVDAPPAREGESRRTWDGAPPDRHREALLHGVIDLRRSLDLLLARPDIDPRRIAFVGQGRGAHLGGILAGVDTRAGSYVLMGGSGAAQGESLQTLDAVRYVGKAAPAALLFQFATADRGVPRPAAFSGGPPFAFRSTLLGSPLYVKALVSDYGLQKLDAPPASGRSPRRPAAADHSPADLLARGLPGRRADAQGRRHGARACEGPARLRPLRRGAALARGDPGHLPVPEGEPDRRAGTALSGYSSASRIAVQIRRARPGRRASPRSTSRSSAPGSSLASRSAAMSQRSAGPPA